MGAPVSAATLRTDADHGGTHVGASSSRPASSSCARRDTTRLAAAAEPPDRISDSTSALDARATPARRRQATASTEQFLRRSRCSSRWPRSARPRGDRATAAEVARLRSTSPCASACPKRRDRQLAHRRLPARASASPTSRTSRCLDCRCTPDQRAMAERIHSAPVRLRERAPARPTQAALASPLRARRWPGPAAAATGRDVPLGARVLALVDAYVDLTMNPFGAAGGTWPIATPRWRRCAATRRPSSTPTWSTSWIRSSRATTCATACSATARACCSSTPTPRRPR